MGQYKKNAFDATAKQDLNIAVTAEEAAYVDNDAYVSCTDANDCESKLPGFVASKAASGNTEMDVFEMNATGDEFTGQAMHSKGETTYSYDSTSGILALPQE